MFILQVFYPPSVVTIAVGMIFYVMDFMLVMMHFNVTIMISWYNPCMMNDKHAKTGKKTADYRPGGGGGGYFRNFWVGMCCCDPETLNLYQS